MAVERLAITVAFSIPAARRARTIHGLCLENENMFLGIIYDVMRCLSLPSFICLGSYWKASRGFRLSL